jgi:hypothetical protein
VKTVQIFAALAFSLLAACGDDSPPPNQPDLGKFVQTGPPQVCVSSCTTNAQCQNSCPEAASGISCCDLATNSCFTSQTMQCPAPPADMTVVGPY